MPSQNGAPAAPTSWKTRTLRMTFSIPSPVELIQLVIQYQRNTGTPSASKRMRRGVTGTAAGAPGVTSSASIFCSAIDRTLGRQIPDRERRLAHALSRARDAVRAAVGPRAHGLAELALHVMEAGAVLGRAAAGQPRADELVIARTAPRLAVVVGTCASRKEPEEVADRVEVGPGRSGY